MNNMNIEETTREQDHAIEALCNEHGSVVVSVHQHTAKRGTTIAHVQCEDDRSWHSFDEDGREL